MVATPILNLNIFKLKYFFCSPHRDLGCDMIESYGSQQLNDNES